MRAGLVCAACAERYLPQARSVAALEAARRLPLGSTATAVTVTRARLAPRSRNARVEL